MACRKRASEQSHNRRRHMMLEKGFELVHSKLETAFGECLLNINVKEVEKMEKVIKVHQRQAFLANRRHDQQIRLFDQLREISSMEPSVLLERRPHSALERHPNALFSTPRYQRPLETQVLPAPSFPQILLFRPQRHRKINVWEPVTLSSGAVLRVKPGFKSMVSSKPVNFTSVGGIGSPLDASERSELLMKDQMYRSHGSSTSGLPSNAQRGVLSSRLAEKKHADSVLDAHLIQLIAEFTKEETESIKMPPVTNEKENEDSHSNADTASQPGDPVFITQWKPQKIQKTHFQLNGDKQDTLKGSPVSLPQSNRAASSSSLANIKLRKSRLYGGSSLIPAGLDSKCQTQESIDFLRSVVKVRPKSVTFRHPRQQHPTTIGQPPETTQKPPISDSKEPASDAEMAVQKSNDDQKNVIKVSKVEHHPPPSSSPPSSSEENEAERVQQFVDSIPIDFEEHPATVGQSIEIAQSD